MFAFLLRSHAEVPAQAAGPGPAAELDAQSTTYFMTDLPAYMFAFLLRSHAEVSAQAAGPGAAAEPAGVTSVHAQL
jgi:hypothetical protein